MTLKQLVEKVASRRDVRIVGAPDGIPGWLSKANEHQDARNYFSEMLPVESYFVCGADFHSIEEIEGEIQEGAWPGGIVYPYGYIPFAKTIGGHQICLSVEDGSVRFADRSRLSEKVVNLRTPEDPRKPVQLSAENLRIGLPVVATDLNEFFRGVADGSLDGPLDHLDSNGYLPEG